MPWYCCCYCVLISHIMQWFFQVICSCTQYSCMCFLTCATANWLYLMFYVLSLDHNLLNLALLYATILIHLLTYFSVLTTISQILFEKIRTFMESTFQEIHSKVQLWQKNSNRNLSRATLYKDTIQHLIYLLVSWVQYVECWDMCPEKVVHNSVT